MYNPQTGLVRFGARDYDVETGRWTTKDLMLFDSQEFNLYGYTENDPINFLDLDGLAKTSIDAAVEQAVLRGDTNQLKVLLENVSNYSKPQQRRLLKICKQNANKIKAETLDVKDAERRLAEALTKGEEAAKGQPQSTSVSGVIAEIIRSLFKFSN